MQKLSGPKHGTKHLASYCTADSAGEVQGEAEQVPPERQVEASIDSLRGVQLLGGGYQDSRSTPLRAFSAAAELGGSRDSFIFPAAPGAHEADMS